MFRSTITDRDHNKIVESILFRAELSEIDLMIAESQMLPFSDLRTAKLPNSSTSISPPTIPPPYLPDASKSPSFSSSFASTVAHSTSLTENLAQKKLNLDSQLDLYSPISDNNVDRCERGNDKGIFSEVESHTIQSAIISHATAASVAEFDSHLHQSLATTGAELENDNGSKNKISDLAQVPSHAADAYGDVDLMIVESQAMLSPSIKEFPCSAISAAVEEEKSEDNNNSVLPNNNIESELVVNEKPTLGVQEDMVDLMIAESQTSMSAPPLRYPDSNADEGIAEGSASASSIAQRYSNSSAHEGIAEGSASASSPSLNNSNFNVSKGMIYEMLDDYQSPNRPPSASNRTTAALNGKAADSKSHQENDQFQETEEPTFRDEPNWCDSAVKECPPSESKVMYASCSLSDKCTPVIQLRPSMRYESHRHSLQEKAAPSMQVVEEGADDSASVAKRVLLLLPEHLRHTPPGTVTGVEDHDGLKGRKLEDMFKPSTASEVNSNSYEKLNQTASNNTEMERRQNRPNANSTNESDEGWISNHKAASLVETSVVLQNPHIPSKPTIETSTERETTKMPKVLQAETTATVSRASHKDTASTISAQIDASSNIKGFTRRFSPTILPPNYVPQSSSNRKSKFFDKSKCESSDEDLSDVPDDCLNGAGTTGMAKSKVSHLFNKPLVVSEPPSSPQKRVLVRKFGTPSKAVDKPVVAAISATEAVAEVNYPRLYIVAFKLLLIIFNMLIEARFSGLVVSYCDQHFLNQLKRKTGVFEQGSHPCEVNYCS